MIKQRFFFYLEVFQQNLKNQPFAYGTEILNK